MDDALALETFSAAPVIEVLPFPFSFSRRQPKNLSPSIGELTRNISSILNDLVVSAREKRTASEFEAERAEVFPKYYAVVRALSSLAVVTIPGGTIERLSAESYSEMEANLREQALSAFGTAVQNQAIFTVWTYRKTTDVCQRIRDGIDVPAELKNDDKELEQSFSFNLVWSQFHLHCLFASMESQQPIYPEVLPVIVEGLRAAVNAYALAVRALELRGVAAPEQPLQQVEWDDEEQALLDEATFDLIDEPA